ncbi:MAG TPA: prepilin peptidase [Candidatus Dorea intestinavium]|nr:prepilin peptidase [Candidatus Dorea intestinavium]
MIIALQLIMYVLVFLMGASIFSFLNVVIYRVPRNMDFIKGRSHCPNCGKALSPLDMIPVFGYLLLKGKCRYCKSKISPRYAVIELLGGLIAVFLVNKFGYNFQAITMFAFFSMLTVVACVDIDTMEIPNGFVLAILIIAIFSFFAFPEITLLQRIIGFFVVSLFLLIVTLIVPGGFGGGDIKLMAACGAFLGWKLCLISFFIAILLGGGYGIALLIRKKKGKKDHFAFGPFLCVGCGLGFLYGGELLSWYLGLWF